ncbi:MAG: Transcriptional repressor SmtB [Chloroflexi bacterium]|nr:Transcriptional repressor SmtB [Chloroflexota bacterium]
MNKIQDLSDIFKALSDPTRLQLIQLLSEQPTGDCPGEPCNGKKFLCVNALAHKLGVTQSAVSQHLRVLRQVGLVHGARHGRFVHYSLDQDGLEQYRAILIETLGKEFAA